MIVTATGTRRQPTTKQISALARELDIMISAAPPNEWRHGGCTGWDELFDTLLISMGVPSEHINVHPASGVSPAWRADFPRSRRWHEPLPPLVRNGIMLSGCNVLLAGPATPSEVLRSGTWSTVRRAYKARVPHVLFLPDGTVERRK